MPSENARRLRPDQIERARRLLAAPRFDRVKLMTNHEQETFVMSRDKTLIAEVMRELAFTDAREIR